RPSVPGAAHPIRSAWFERSTGKDDLALMQERSVTGHVSPSVSSPSSELPLIIDCDPGIDDSIALLAAASLHHTGLLSLRGVVAVSGNAPSTRTAANAALVLHRAGLDLVPIYQGSTGPLTH